MNRESIFKTVGIAAAAAMVFCAGCAFDANEDEPDDESKQPAKYTLTISAGNGGTVSPDVGKHDYESGTYVTVKATPIPGYDFSKWTGTGSTSASTNPSITVTMNANKTLTPVFKESAVPSGTYTLTIAANPADGGRVIPAVGTHPFDAGLSVPVTAAANTGYRFVYWTGASSGIRDTTTVKMDGNKTLTAYFELITYTMTFDANGGEGAVPAITVNSGSTLTIPAGSGLTRGGYVFNGWNAKSNGSDTTTYRVGAPYTPKSDITLYAQWALVTYTITFNPNGGTVNPTSSKTAVGGKLSSLPTPTLIGNTFNGWFTERTGGVEVTTNTVFEANTTIYAQWTLITYTLTFSISPTNGGTTTPAGSLTDLKQDTTINISAAADVKNGYFFDTWEIKPSSGGGTIANLKSPTTTVTVKGDVTVTAKFTKSGSTPSGTRGKFNDRRDNITYGTLKIGNDTWMTENLNYDKDINGNYVGRCYGDPEPNTDEVESGINNNTCLQKRLYNFSEAQNACPKGWHLSTDAEWTALENHLGGKEVAGKKLKSKDMWYNNGGGTDTLEKFSITPEGGFITDNYQNKDYDGYWWSFKGKNAPSFRNINYNSDEVFSKDLPNKDLNNRYLVRCVQD